MPKVVTPVRPSIMPIASSLAISGRVRNAATGYSLSDLQIQVLYIEPLAAPSITPLAPRLLGSARSDGAGSWRIVWDTGPAVSQLVCLLANCDEAQFEVRVVDKAGASPLLVTRPASAARREIVLDLAVPISPRPLTKAQWNDLGHRVSKAGPVTLSTVVNQLAQAGATTPIFRDWPLARRQNALAALESGFLDPHGTLGTIAPLPSWQVLAAPGGLDAYLNTLGGEGHRKAAQTALTEMSQKLAAFPSLSAVDWLIEPTLFGRDPAVAITANQDQYFGPNPKPWPVLQTPEMGYRDYLRTQWTSMVGLVVLVPPHQLTEAQSEQQLRNRFHQDFNVTSSKRVAANEVLIPILTEILISPAGNTFGFGVAASSIPARGTATARAYLNTLISISGHSAAEISLRYRTDFTRPDSTLSSSVWENIHTLQGFFRDSFQSIVDPAHTDPDVLGQRIIPDLMQGRAPWFLEYDEWLLLQQPIPFENYVQIREIFQMTISAENRTTLANHAASGNIFAARASFWVKALAINDALQKAFASFDQSEYRIALDAYNSVVDPLWFLLNDPIVTAEDIAGDFAKRRALKVTSLVELNAMLTTWQVGDFSLSGQAGDNAFDIYFTANIPRLVPSLIYLAQFSLPTFIAQAAMVLGNWADALRPLGRAAFFLVSKATISDQDRAAWRDWLPNESDGAFDDFPLYSAGNLPYSVDTRHPLPRYPNLGDDDSRGWNPGISGSLPLLLDSLVPKGLHPVEALFYRLQMGDAILGWADKLYRTDQAASISRARELYKGVYFLHGSVPPINPIWTSAPILGGFFAGNVNPAKAAQLARGRLGFAQIEAGLNFFGFADDMIPSLRYLTLKPAADAFAAGAKSVERDFLAAMSQIESATVDDMKNNAMVRRASLQVQIAQQQAGVAHDQVIQANALIAQVNFQIAQLEKQIADHDSFFGQLGDYLSGMASDVKGAGSVLSETKSAGTALGADTSGLALSGGAGVMAGFGAFAVFSYVTMSSMAEAADLRDKQLSNLGNNLASANAQLDIAQRNSTIAGLMQQVAQSDADLATSLLAFAQERYLNIEFWSYMAGLFRRLMRQYLDLAARTGWLAQQALGYEQRAPMGVISFDYFPEQYQGAGGADQLQLDLADLEAQRLNGLHEMVPIKYTYSLSRDFPLQFAQLQKTGTCIFQTSDAALQVAFPGTYGYRVLAATPRLVAAGVGAPMRGMLTNSGVSQISGSDGKLQLSIRPSDGLPITEFDIKADMSVFGLPGTTLMQFEGGGIETIWQIDLPLSANPGGFAGLADALVTFDLRARFDPSLYQSATGLPVTSMSKMLVFSALRLKVAGLTDLLGPPTVARLDFDLTSVGLPALEKTRKLSNLFFVLVSSIGNSIIQAEVIAATPANTIKLTLAGGVVYSNNPPMSGPLSTAPLSPLNVLAGIDVNQTLTLRIDKTANAGIDFTKVNDVILGVDYTATV
jgi:hypothetical protein